MKTAFDHPGWIDALSDNYTLFQRDLKTLPVRYAAEPWSAGRASTKRYSAIALAVGCSVIFFYCFLGVLLS
jgi:hypothetical protein